MRKVWGHSFLKEEAAQSVFVQLGHTQAYPPILGEDQTAISALGTASAEMESNTGTFEKRKEVCARVVEH